jgi:hypothetical protein
VQLVEHDFLSVCGAGRAGGIAAQASIALLYCITTVQHEAWVD